MKKFILNADDFGLSKEHNEAVYLAIKKGLLKSASVMVNGKCFKEAVEIIKKYPFLSTAVHLNIIEGKALTCCPLLTDKEGNFNKSYFYFLLNQNNKTFLKQVEEEFEAQIIKGKTFFKIDRLDSHVHTHAISNIFKVAAKLADKYNIKFIRTQKEIPYFCKNKILKPINLVKVALLRYFTFLNQKTLKKYNLKTNDYILGVAYTGMMDDEIIKKGLKLNNKGLVECLIHPALLKKKNFYQEFLITQNLELKKYIEDEGFKIADYKTLL